MKHAARPLILLLAALLLAACARPAAPPASNPPASSAAAPPASEPPASSSPPAEALTPPDKAPPASDTGRRYTLYFGEETYHFDNNGDIVPEEESFTVISDSETGEELYRVHTREEDTGEDDEWGNPVTEHLSALYSADGELLCDWEPISYRQAAGRLLIRSDYVNMFMGVMPGAEIDAALWDPATGENVLEGVMSLERLEPGIYLALDPLGKLLGTVDEEGNRLNGFPAPVECFYPSGDNGYIIADTHNPYQPMPVGFERKNYLLDNGLNILVENESINISFVGLRGPYMLRTVGGMREVASLDGFETLFRYNDDLVSLDYFDGERMIIRTGERGSWRYTLHRVESPPSGGSVPQGEPLTGEYDHILWDSSDRDDDSPAEQFLAYRGEEVFLLDRDGNILRQAAVPGAVRFSYDDAGFFGYAVKGETDEYGYTTEYVGLLDENFNVVVPAGKYTSIHQAVEYSKDGTLYYDYLIGYKDVNGLSRRDLLGLDGSVVIDNLSEIGTITEDRICVVRGFSMGLMDRQGNWIARHSVYDGFGRSD